MPLTERALMESAAVATVADASLFIEGQWHAASGEEFASRYVTAARAISVGDPAEDADMGPMASAEQWEKTAGAVRRAVEDADT